MLATIFVRRGRDFYSASMSSRIRSEILRAGIVTCDNGVIGQTFAIRPSPAACPVAITTATEYHNESTGTGTLP